MIVAYETFEHLPALKRENARNSYRPSGLSGRRGVTARTSPLICVRDTRRQAVSASKAEEYMTSTVCLPTSGPRAGHSLLSGRRRFAKRHAREIVRRDRARGLRASFETVSRLIRDRAVNASPDGSPQRGKKPYAGAFCQAVSGGLAAPARCSRDRTDLRHLMPDLFGFPGFPYKYPVAESSQLRFFPSLQHSRALLFSHAASP